MTFEKAIFYFFAIMLIFAAVRVITVRSPVHAALHLVLAFFASSALWMLMEAEFLAITLVLVYVGAVMVLFLFVVMMLDINISKLREGFVSYLPLGFLVALVILVEMALVIAPDVFGLKPGFFGLEQYSSPLPHTADYSNTAELGSILYTVYVYPFEIAAAILLVAIVAAISLTMRDRPDSKRQVPSEQVKVKREDRLKIIKLESEPGVESGVTSDKDVSDKKDGDS